jgi:hypothetical protein
MPVRKRGRPTTREKALECDRDLVDAKSIRPGAWRKTPIRHPVYLTGLIYGYRVKPDTTTVWQARYPDAPGGMQEFELETEEFEEAIECYKGFMERIAAVTLRDVE